MEHQQATKLLCYTCKERKPRDEFPRPGAKICTVCFEADAPKKRKLERRREQYIEKGSWERRLNAKWKTDNRDAYLKQQREAAKVKREAERIVVLNHYGGACSCCGETEPLFLQIDHINGNGHQHRREIGKTDMIKWLVIHNFPDGFQLLCANCNTGKHRNGGTCPHERERSESVA